MRPLGIAASLITLVGLSTVLYGGISPASATTPPTTTKPKAVVQPAPTTTLPVAAAAAENPPQVPTTTVLASPNGQVPYYSAPNGVLEGTVGTWYGYPLTLPVINQQLGWLEVRLPWRPNESTGWVQDGAVTMSSTPYRIQVNLATMHLTLFNKGYPVGSFPVGIGVPATPTVTGNFFVAVKEINPGPGYGPFALDTSAHSDAIWSFDGSGDAIIAIHGPITSYADAEIGTTGARVSNGCIRMHESDQVQLSNVGVGTPVDIVAG